MLDMKNIEKIEKVTKSFKEEDRKKIEKLQIN